MFKNLKVVLVLLLLSFFSPKMEAKTMAVDFVGNTQIKKQSTVTTNDNTPQGLGILIERNLQVLTIHFRVNSAIAFKKYIVKLFVHSISNQESDFSTKVTLKWNFCRKKEIPFTTFQIIYPFHSFW